MRLRRRMLDLSRAAMILAAVALATAARADEPKKVLLLESYHQGYAWTDEQTRGVLDALGAPTKQVEIYIEYMGTKWANDPEYFEQLRRSYLSKFAKLRFDAIVATDNDAFNFLRANRDAVFGRIPTIFSGVNDLRRAELEGQALFTGVGERPDFAAGLELALRLHPGAKRIAVVIDGSLSGRKIKAQFMEAAAAFQGRVAFEYLDRIGMDELVRRVASLTPDALVFHLLYFTDGTGKPFTNEESTYRVTRAARVPVYGAWDFSLGHGIVGGKLLDGYAHGRLAGEMARRVLGGERVDDIPVVTSSPTRFLFDARELRRFGIHQHDLPPGSTLIHEPPSFYAVNKQLVWGTVLAMACLAGVVALLLRVIAGRRRTEAKLRESEARYRAIVDGFDGFINISSSDFRLEFTNKAFARRAGRDPVGERCHRVLYGLDAACPWCRMDEVLAGQTIRREMRDPADGRCYYAIDTPVRHPDGRISKQTVAIDITDRKRAEDALRDSEEEFRTLVDNLNVGVFRAVHDGRGRFLQVNPALAKMLGYASPQDLMTVPLADLYQDPTQREQLSRELHEGGVVRDREITLRKRDGSTVSACVTATLHRDERGGVLWTDGILEDVTERRRMEAELLQAQKLESVGLLAGGIAHDFNNLLTAILGNISAARSAAADGDLLEPLADAEAASLQARELARRLLTFAEGGTPVKRAVAVRELVAACARLARNASASTCALDLPDGLWPVEADEAQVAQVLSNLILNADQAMPGAGTVTVGCRNVEGGAVPPQLAPGRYVEIAVRDQGTGIRREHLARIFDPFFSTKGTGRGLGLATAYSIVKQHGGCITVDSAPGEGSTFTVLLPASSGPAAPPLTAKQAVAGKGRILVMDDEVGVQRALRRMLTRLGYEVQCASDGAEAAEVYARALRAGVRFDAVIMDLTVPGGMGGKDGLKRLLEIDPRVRAIVSSGYSNDPVMSDYQAHGFAGVIGKPYRLEDLGETLREAIASAA